MLRLESFPSFGSKWKDIVSVAAAPHRRRAVVKGPASLMFVPPAFDDPAPRPSRFIAEALVGRYGPLTITTRTTELGFPRPLTNAILAACTATAIDASWTRRRPMVAMTP